MRVLLATGSERAERNGWERVGVLVSRQVKEDLADILGGKTDGNVKHGELA